MRTVVGTAWKFRLIRITCGFAVRFAFVLRMNAIGQRVRKLREAEALGAFPAHARHAGRGLCHVPNRFLSH